MKLPTQGNSFALDPFFLFLLVMKMLLKEKTIEEKTQPISNRKAKHWYKSIIPQKQTNPITEIQQKRHRSIDPLLGQRINHPIS